MKKSTMKKLMAKEIQKGFRKYAPIEDIERICVPLSAMPGRQK